MFWQKVFEHSYHEGLGSVVLAVIVIGASMLAFRRSEARATILTVGLFVLCLAALLLSGLLAAAGYPVAGAYLRALAIFGEGLCLVRLCGIALFRGVLNAWGLTTTRIVQDVLMALAYVAWAVLWLHANGMDPTNIVTTSAVITAVLAFSLQDTLGNILGGIAVQIDRSVRVGDWLRVGDQVGRVVQISWRHTSLETRNWETVVIPNSALVKGQFLILGRRTGQPEQWRRWIRFNVDFRYPPTKIIETVEHAMRSAQIPNVARTPSPSCVFMDFAESYGKYALRYWLTDLFVDDPTDSAVRTDVYFALKRAGIPLSIPAQALFLTQETDQRAARKARQSLASRLQTFEHNELLRHLPQEQRVRFAEHLIPSPYAPGDIIARQGSEADWLYLIREGTVDVTVENGQGNVSKVAELGPGSLFGEMALMLGEPRSASVIARTPVQAYRLDKQSFKEIIGSQPDVAEEISSLLARRQTELDSVIASLKASTSDNLPGHGHRLLEKIRHFFGLE